MLYHVQIRKQLTFYKRNEMTIIIVNYKKGLIKYDNLRETYRKKKEDKAMRDRRKKTF